MKNKILHGAMLFCACLLPLHLNAQLEVLTSGDVKASKNVEVLDTLKVGDDLKVIHDVTVGNKVTISNNAAIGAATSNNIGLNIEHISTTISPYYGIYSHIKTNYSMPTSSVYGMCGFADASLTTSQFPINQVVGVYGKASKTPATISAFSAGVAGMAHYYGGIGVYGGIGSAVDLPLPTTWKGSAYAGYFDGTVNVNGSIFANNLSNLSDLNQMENTRQVSSESAQNIHSLKPVSYTLKQDGVSVNDKDAKELQSVHYGLIAQDVQKLFPELVYERDGQLSINYIELIPLLIMNIQELSAEVEELKKSK